MAANTPFMVVEQGPRFTPLRFGLLSAAQIVDDPSPNWQLGTEFQPDACDPAHGVTSFCVAGGAATGTPTKTITATGAPSSAAEPFTVYAYTSCPPIGWDDNLTRYIDRAKRHLDQGEGRAVEQLFWTGVPHQGPTVFPHLAANAQVLADAPVGTAYRRELQQAATVLSGSFTIITALAAVEGALAACYGGEGVLHVPFDMLTLFAEKGVVVREGPQLRTLGGMIVAAYAPSPKTGPDGSTAAAGSGWIYGTGAVVARRSPVKPAAPEPRPSSFVGRTDNSTVLVVERTFVFDWDCCLIAARGGYSAAVGP